MSFLNTGEWTVHSGDASNSRDPSFWVKRAARLTGASIVDGGGTLRITDDGRMFDPHEELG
jgi:hypothetical protein